MDWVSQQLGLLHLARPPWKTNMEVQITQPSTWIEDLWDNMFMKLQSQSCKNALFRVIGNMATVTDQECKINSHRAIKWKVLSNRKLYIHIEGSKNFPSNFISQDLDMCGGSYGWNHAAGAQVVSNARGSLPARSPCICIGFQSYLVIWKGNLISFQNVRMDLFQVLLLSQRHDTLSVELVGKQQNCSLRA